MNHSADDIDQAAKSDVPCVADQLPPTADPPDSARPISFWRGLLCFWLQPRTLGPHLAAGSWQSAITAHFVAPLLAALIHGDILFRQLGFLPETPAAPMGSGEPVGFREQAAELILNMATETAAMPAINWVVPALLLALVPGVELVILIVGVLLMPWAAAGDSGWSVWRRSVKLLYWCTGIVIPVALIVRFLRFLASSASPLDQYYTWYVELPFIVAWTVAFLLILHAGRMIVLGLARYVGPPGGPAFAPREPRCDECGYLIIGLPLESKCPECGLAVRESLPGGRRSLPRWCVVQLRPGGFAEILRLQAAAIFDRSWFRRLAVHSGLSAARHFWWGTCGLMMLAAAGMTSAFHHLSSGTIEYDQLQAIRALAVLAIIVLQQAVVSAFAGMWAERQRGVADYRCSAIVSYYAAPLAWPAVIMMAVGLLTMERGVRAVSQTLSSSVPTAGVRSVSMSWINPNAAIEAAIWALIWVAYACSVIFWTSRLRSALAATRFANV